jgi:CspA family cold shock protein
MACADRVVKCEECGSEFVFRVEEQRRMAARGEIAEPERCPSCRRGEGGEGNGQRFSGVVKWFNQSKGYGFIARDDGAGELFVHYSDIEYAGFKVLYEGERVEFGVRHGRRGDRAVKVTGHDPFAP